jgi:hypothetical protein
MRMNDSSRLRLAAYAGSSWTIEASPTLSSQCLPPMSNLARVYSIAFLQAEIFRLTRRMCFGLKRNNNTRVGSSN